MVAVATSHALSFNRRLAETKRGAVIRALWCCRLDLIAYVFSSHCVSGVKQLLPVVAVDPQILHQFWDRTELCRADTHNAQRLYT